MGSIGATLADMRNNPRNVRFGDAVKLAEAHFGAPRRSGSHHVFRTPWPGDPRVNLQAAADGKAKAYQVRQLLAAIDRLEMTRARENEREGERRDSETTGKRAKIRPRG